MVSHFYGIVCRIYIILLHRVMGIRYYLSRIACAIISLSIRRYEMEIERLSLTELIRLAEKSTDASYDLIQRELASRAIVETAYDASQDTYVNPPEASSEWVGVYQIPTDPMDELNCDSCQ